MSWAQAARVASSVCNRLGAFTTGYFTGNQDRGHSYGLVCLGVNVQYLTASWADLDATGWRVDGIVQTDYAQALRAAHGFCQHRGLKTGFLTGRQFGDQYSVACQY